MAAKARAAFSNTLGVGLDAAGLFSFFLNEFMAFLATFLDVGLLGADPLKRKHQNKGEGKAR